MAKQKTKCGKIFIYLAVIAIILGIIGVIIIQKNISGKVIGGEQSYSLSEVSSHDSERDCWEINDRKVYDVTLLVQIYPGDLKAYCGREVALPLDRDLLQQYEIGSLD
ncbi:MAG: hypothetical protein NT076_04665 [Candidatus Pacearchaeota archaeon]|nr:hypothetical protein [Candidatus Pacearchaeota archaeon]